MPWLTTTLRLPSQRLLVLSGAIFAVGILVLVGVQRMRGSNDAGEKPTLQVTGTEAPRLPRIEGESIRFSEEFIRRNNVHFAEVQLEELLPMVSVHGTVTFDTRLFSAVGARLSGRIRKIFKIEGDVVKAGEPLLEIESAELARLEAALLATRAREVTADTQRQREQRLAAANITSKRDAELAKVDYEARRAERIAAQKAIHALRGDSRGELGVLVLHAPIDGKIITSRASRGQTVEPSDTLFEVADLRTLWVELRVFEQDIFAIAPGDPVEIAIEHQQSNHTGEVEQVGDVVDLKTRTAKVRVVFDNSGLVFRPGQSVRATILTRAELGKKPTIWTRAIARIDGQPRVFRQINGTTVQLQPIEIGPTSGDKTVVLSGLTPGDVVVTDGVFALKSELFR